MRDETSNQLPPDGLKGVRFSRRFFFIVLLGGLFGFVAWMYRRTPAVLSIQNFFGLDHSVQVVIKSEIETLKKEHFSWWAASVFFFTLADWDFQAIVPRRIRYRIVNYWSWRLLSRRSIGWKYVNYPSVSDEPICDGLIRPD
jgi:hypothetical protein